ncbi:MAG: tripartite tricarboxylate transporter TctB family protein, partial [Ideonella sp.]
TAQRLPLLLIWIVIGMAALMIAEDILKRRQSRRAPAPVAVALADAEDDTVAAVNWPVLCGFGVAIVAYVALIPVVGYLITTTAFITGSLWVSKIMSPFKAVSIGILTTAGVWAVFILALNLPVPILPFLK